MAKALKIAAGVVAIAGLALITGGLAAGASLSFVLGASSGIAGLTVSGLFTAAALLNTGASLLSPRPKVPETSASNADRLTVSINTRAPRVTVVGRTAMATDLRDQEWSADQSYLHRFVVVASHRVAAIREIWFDDKLAWTSAGGVQGAFAGFLGVVPVLEGSPANAIDIGPRMGSSRRYTGLAYVYLSYKLSKNGKVDSPFASSIPSRMTIVGDGASFYDPRLDSTVPGGSGPMRAGDQATWSWSPSACRNPALAMLFYLLGWRIQNPVTGVWKLAVGKGIPAARIDLASFITAANLCDEAVTKADGSSEPRYRCDGVWSEQDDPSLVLENLKATMNAVLDDVDGKIRVSVLHNDLATPIGQLTAADVMGAFTWTQTPALSDCVNVLRGGYTDPSSTALYQLVDFPEARIDSPDGIDRAQTLNLPLVQSPSQAQRLVKTRLQRAQYPGSFQATFLSTAWRFQKGDVVEFSFYPLGWDRKLFRIADMATQVDGQVPMLLREEHTSIYAFDGTETGAVQGAEPTRYDPALWPLVQSIAEATKTADDAAELAALAQDAANAARLLIAGKTRFWVQPTPPTAAESGDLDRWSNTAEGGRIYDRLPGSGRLAFNGDRLTLGGDYLMLAPWRPATDQGAQALIAAAGAQATADRKVLTFSQEAQPTAEDTGDLWYRPSTKVLARWSGAIWLDVATVGATPAQIEAIGQALTSAENAQATADGKIDVFYQPSPPAGSVGDLWYDTDDGNKIYRHDGFGWVILADTRIAQAVTAAAGAQATADGKVSTYLTTAPPIATAIGDLWYNPATGILARWTGTQWGSTADATALNELRVSDVTDIRVMADYTGAINAGQLPQSRTPRLYLGSGDVTANADFSVSVTSGATVTLNNDAGSDERGTVTLTALSAASATISVTATYFGRTMYKTWRVVREDAAPPAGGGSGGSGGSASGPASTSSFVAPGTNTTHQVLATLAAVTTGAGGKVSVTAPLSFYAEPEGGVDISQDVPTATTMKMKAAYSADGGSSWTDAPGGEIGGGSAVNYFRLNSPKGSKDEPGSINYAATVTGLASGTSVIVRIMGRMDDGLGIRSVTGTATATPA